ncbi:MAG: class I SAM-dependent methyltransferase [Asgard group archaeon]|nr:class I SAM-dependent methyltransferase [Asgard group archaeon]
MNLLGDNYMSMYDRIEFFSISIMHDYMYRLLMKPEKLLNPTGIKKDDKVLEVGCGPGFFTLPAAEIVGKDGIIYAIDINPFAIKKIEKKINKKNVTNVKPMLVNITETGLPERSIDLAFFFGVIHNLYKIIDQVLEEMDRILKKDGIISIQKSRKKTKNLVSIIEKSGKFILDENLERVINFRRK